jgi:hypothetical protein
MHIKSCQYVSAVPEHLLLKPAAQTQTLEALVQVTHPGPFNNPTQHAQNSTAKTLAVMCRGLCAQKGQLASKQISSEERCLM